MKTVAVNVLALISSSACRSQPVRPVQPELTQVELGETRAGEDPMNRVRALHARVEAELRQAASSDRAKIAVGRDTFGPRGERVLIAAITPKHGSFALVPNGVYEDDSAVGLARRLGGKAI